MLTKFNSTVIDDADGVINAAVKTGTIYAKAYGVDISKGIGLAMAQQQRFAQQARKDQDVFLGLSNTFDGLTMALLEGGIQFEEITHLTKLGQEDPIKYAQSIRSMYEQLGGDHSMFAKRFLENVRKNVDPAMAKLLVNEKALARAMKERSLIEKAGLNITGGNLKDFNDLSETMSGIGAVALGMIENLKGLFKTIVGTAFSKVMSESFKSALPVLQQFNEALSRSAQEVVHSPFWKQAEPVLIGIGKGLIAIGVAAGELATTFAATIIPIKVLGTLFKTIPLIGRPTVVTMEKLSKGAFAFAKGVFNAVAGVTGIGVALNDFGKALKSQVTGPKLVLRAFRAMALGIVETFDGALGGLPTWLATKFFPEMTGTIGDNTKLMFQKLSAGVTTGIIGALGGVWRNVTDYMRDKWGDFRVYIWQNFTELDKTAKTWGENIGRSIGTLAKWAWDEVQDLLDPDLWARAWKSITDFFSGKGKAKMEKAFGMTLTSLWEMSQSFGKSLIDEMLRPWGDGWIEFESTFLDVKDSLAESFAWMQNEGLPKTEQAWLRFKMSMLDAFFGIKDGGIEMFQSLKANAMSVLGPVLWAASKLQRYVLKGKLEDAEEAHADAGSAYTRAANRFEIIKSQGRRMHGSNYGKTLSAAITAKDEADKKWKATRSAEADARLSHARAAENVNVYDNWSDEAARLKAKIPEDAINRRKRSKERKKELGYDKAADRLKELEKPGTGELDKGAAAQKLLAKAFKTDREARHEDEGDRAFNRDLKRPGQDARQMQDVWKAADMKLGYLSRTDKILKSIQPWMSQHNKEYASGARFLYNKIEMARGELSEASTPSAVKSAWTSVMDAMKGEKTDWFLQKQAGELGFDPKTGALDPKTAAPLPSSAAGGNAGVGDISQLGPLPPQKVVIGVSSEGVGWLNNLITIKVDEKARENYVEVDKSGG